MAECKTQMRAGGGSQQRPVSLRQRMARECLPGTTIPSWAVPRGNGWGQDWRAGIVPGLFLLS